MDAHVDAHCWSVIGPTLPVAHGFMGEGPSLPQNSAVLWVCLMHQMLHELARGPRPSWQPVPGAFTLHSEMSLNRKSQEGWLQSVGPQRAGIVTTSGDSLGDLYQKFVSNIDSSLTAGDKYLGNGKQ